MLINFIDSIPLDNGTFGYGVTAGGTSAYCAHCTDEGILLLPINVTALQTMTKGVPNGIPTDRKTKD